MDYSGSGISFGRHIPFLDSRIVQDMIKKESYWYNTFAGMRVSEIQSRSDVDNWLHVPSAQNIADILTKGAPPSALVEGSCWQSGPVWLLQEESYWPVTDVRSACNVDDEISQFLTCDKRLRSAAHTTSTQEIDILNGAGIHHYSFARLQLNFERRSQNILICWNF